MRSIKEIVERVRSSDSIFGFDKEVLVSVLPFEHTKPFLQPGAGREGGEAEITTEDALLAQAVGCLGFAVMKAVNHRGLSAERSLEKMREFIWLLGHDELLAQVDDAPYQNYGCPALRLMVEFFDCAEQVEYLKMDWSRNKFERMARGEPCESECYEGCGI